MKPYNYVQEAWEQRFQIHRTAPWAEERFAFGFMIGVACTSALLLLGVAAHGSIGL